MISVEDLRKSRDNYSVVWKEFLEDHLKFPNNLFCFFEGGDEKYYGIRIQSKLPFRYSEQKSTFECHGKNNVIKLYELVSRNPAYKNTLLAFFIDRDFDDPKELPNDKRVFITTNYSIENYFISVNAFKRILENEFHQKNRGSQSIFYKNLVDLYETRFEEFLDAIDLLMAAIFFYKKQSTIIETVNLDDIRIFSLIEVSLYNIKQKYTLIDLVNIFKIDFTLNSREIADILNNFKKNNRSSLYRGKYLIEFLRWFLEKIKMDATKTTPKHFPSKRSVCLNLSKKNIISELSQYADTPAELDAFLKNIFVT
ncbi:DUF4435 domain-containing protein [Patescibacteria group bacterium]|nr:DUF4435 domain-containing protein [Patescibacteria group bacterium]